MNARLFTDKQLDGILGCLKKASSCLEAHYRFSPREWFPYSYDLITGRNFPDGLPPRETTVLAEVVRNQRKSAVLSSAGATVPDAYTVILYDPHILKLADEEGHADSLDALMLYILTHELIHIARFFHLVDYDATEESRPSEEARVHALTRRVLKQLADERILQITDRYDNCVYSF